MSKTSLRVTSGLLAGAFTWFLATADHSKRSNSDLVKFYVITVFFGSFALLGESAERVFCAMHGMKSQEQPSDKKGDSLSSSCEFAQEAPAEAEVDAEKNAGNPQTHFQ